MLKPGSLALTTASTVLLGLVCATPGTNAATSQARTASQQCADLEIVAHRGLHPAGTDENTIAAFRGASDSGYSIETDVWSDAEGGLWMFHDRSTWRSTGVRGSIDEMSTAEVAALRYRDTGDRVATFERAMQQWTTTPSTRVYVEVKLVEDVNAVADQIRQADRLDATFLTSYTPYTHRTSPDIRTLYKVPNSMEEPEPSIATELGADVVALPRPALTRARVAEFQSAGVEVQGYNSNARSSWATALEARVNGQLTDDPDVLRGYCRQYTSPPRISRVVAAADGKRKLAIRGRHLATAETVTIAGHRAKRVTAAPRRLVVKLPLAAGRIAKVRVRTPAGTAVTERVRVRRT